MTKKELKAMLASYARSVVGAASALYVAGVTDPKDLWAALVGALIPVAARRLLSNLVSHNGAGLEMDSPYFNISRYLSFKTSTEKLLYPISKAFFFSCILSKLFT
jgi:hypothetical protein